MQFSKYARQEATISSINNNLMSLVYSVFPSWKTNKLYTNADLFQMTFFSCCYELFILWSRDAFVNLPFVFFILAQNSSRLYVFACQRIPTLILMVFFLLNINSLYVYLI